MKLSDILFMVFMSITNWLIFLITIPLVDTWKTAFMTVAIVWMVFSSIIINIVGYFMYGRAKLNE